MRAYQLTGPSLAQLQATVLPDPEPGPGEVLVRLRAASLNFIDLALATGQYPGVHFPLVPVTDGAGEVAALGAGVTGFAVGDRVVPHFMPDWPAGAITPQHVAARRGVTAPGSLADLVSVPARALVTAPTHLSFAQAATMPIAGTTAWNALRAAEVRPGSVVTLLGTGGVSIWALQLAKAMGATVIITSSSHEKLERARALGADHIVHHGDTPAWDERVLQLTDGRGADLVLETVGQATFARSLNAAATGGTVFTVGFVTGTQLQVDLFPIIAKALRVVGNNTGSVADLADLARAVAASRLEPVIGASFGFDDAAAAYALLAHGGRHFGKLAIVH